MPTPTQTEKTGKPAAPQPRAIQWFDLKSIAYLFGVKKGTVQRWIQEGKLAAIRRNFLYPYREGVNNKRVSGSKYYVSRPDLEDFLVYHWKSGKDGRRRVTVENLIHMGQAHGDIKVTVEPDMPIESPRKLISTQLLDALQRARTNAGLTPVYVRPKQIVNPRDRRPRKPVQLELFDADEAGTHGRKSRKWE